MKTAIKVHEDNFVERSEVYSVNGGIVVISEDHNVGNRSSKAVAALFA